MKKIYIFLASVFFISNAFAQNFSVLDMERNNIAGDTIRISALQNDSLQLHLMLVNDYTKNISILAKKYEMKVQEGSENTFCLGTCYPPTTYVATSPVEIAAGDTNKTAFYLDFYPKGTTGENIIGITFYNEVNEADSIQVVFKITVEEESTPTAVHQEERNDMMRIFPNPVKDYLTLQWNPIVTNQSPNRIKIYGVSGKLVLEKRIENFNSVVLPVHDLQKGVYIIHLTGMENLVTRKFLKQ
jgi:hypothetical protein